VGWVVALALAVSSKPIADIKNFQPSQHNIPNTSSNYVLTTIVKDGNEQDLRRRLRVGESVLLRRESDDQWEVLSEQDKLGYIDNEAARVVTFRSDAIGSPKAKVTRIDLDQRNTRFLVDLEISFT
jgi:hypothetical protein